MAQNRYTFADFDAEEAKAAAPPPPAYSDAELETARAEAFAAGHRQGLSEASQRQEESLLRLLQNLSFHFQAVIAAEENRNQQAQQDAMRVALAAFRHVLPTYLARNGHSEIDATIQQFLAEKHRESRLVIRVADGLLDALQSRIDSLATQQGYGGKIILLADNSLGIGDVKIEWADGGAERNTRKLVDSIETTLTTTL